ncbi:MAG TPA: ATP-binding cassette domain-containing protein [Polyangia bacterium]|nr:ATP-binding cassette domain-containing protein [Polyangia bacterium]
MSASPKDDTRPAAGAPVVVLDGVRKCFGDQVIYQSLSLSVNNGETFTVLGPSGVGKSVMLKLLIGLHRPDGGRVIVAGEEVNDFEEAQWREVRRKVGMLFQGAALFDSLDVGDNVAYGLREHYKWPEDKVRARVAECLASVGLPDTERMRPSDLSGGMRKRVGLARALAPGPEIILYDEPTTGLDPTNTRRINELIVSLQAKLGVTSIVITHDIASALAVSDRIALLENGQITLTIDAKDAERDPPERLSRFMRGEGEDEQRP